MENHGMTAVEGTDSIDQRDAATDGGQIIEAPDGGRILGAREPAVEYTYHVEDSEQGGEEYCKCTECGAELLTCLGGPEKIHHRKGCSAGVGR